MKRLLRVSFDIFLTSFTPIISWFLIGVIIDKNLTNVFSITYPIQCIYGAMISLFGIGANVCIYKDKNKNAADNGIFYGTIVSTLIYLFIVLNAKKYILFMNMDPDIYLIFTVYSIIQLLLQIVLQLVLTKLYYEDKNRLANKISFLFNIVNFLVLILTALVTKTQVLTVVITLSSLFLFDLFLLFKYVKKIDFKLNIKNCIKYDSVSFAINILFFFIYFFGISNSFSYGEKYIVAITFVSIITDIQWDITSAVKTVAKIDIVKKDFDYNYHFKNAVKLIFILISLIFVMGIIMYPIYKPDINIVSIFIILHIIDFLTVPFCNIKMCYLEMEYSSSKTTTNNIIAFIIRTIICIMPTPFCIIIGQLASSSYELCYATIKFIKHGKKTIKGEIK